MSSLCSPRTPPQEAVLLLVTWRRQPRLLSPALPRHLRHTKAVTFRVLPGREAGQSACLTDLCASRKTFCHSWPGDEHRASNISSGLCLCVHLLKQTHTPVLSPHLYFCKEQGENQLKNCCTRLYRLNYLFFVVKHLYIKLSFAIVTLTPHRYLHLFLIPGVKRIKSQRITWRTAETVQRFILTSVFHLLWKSNLSLVMKRLINRH